MHTKSTSELGYANAALLLGLIEVLKSKGVLTRSDLNTLIIDALDKLEPRHDLPSMEGGIELIKSLYPEINGAV